VRVRAGAPVTMQMLCLMLAAALLRLPKPPTPLDSSV
jgi:hypothetical protein